MLSYHLIKIKYEIICRWHSFDFVIVRVNLNEVRVKWDSWVIEKLLKFDRVAVSSLQLLKMIALVVVIVRATHSLLFSLLLPPKWLAGKSRSPLELPPSSQNCLSIDFLSTSFLCSHTHSALERKIGRLGIEETTAESRK